MESNLMPASILIPVVSYLLGAVPFGIIFSRAFGGPDPMTAGSKNIGFTNVLRTAGKAPAVFTLLFDGAKGWILIFLFKETLPPVLVLVTGFMAVAGHNFSIYLKFKGGKGVATGFGALLGISPFTGFALIAIWLLVFYKTRISSLSAISAYIILPVIAFFSTPDFLIFSVCLSTLILVRHHQNIKRLISGEEFQLKARR